MLAVYECSRWREEVLLRSRYDRVNVIDCVLVYKGSRCTAVYSVEVQPTMNNSACFALLMPKARNRRLHV